MTARFAAGDHRPLATRVTSGAARSGQIAP